jgi:hypothetical protein
LGVNAPSGFTGRLFDYQINGGSHCSYSSGRFQIGQPRGELVALGFGSFSATAWEIILDREAGATGRIVGLKGKTVSVPREGVIAWTNDLYQVNTTIDLALRRRVANTLAQYNGTNAQKSEIYNTFTSDTNFERFNIRWDSNELILDAEAGSNSGTLRGIKLGSAATSLLGFYGATPVVRPAAVADATDAASAISQLNAVLARLRTLGLIAT